MNANSIIYLSDEEKAFLKKFFSLNKEWIDSSNLCDYETIVMLGDMYEAFLNENSLGDNDNLRAFLLEIRSWQLKISTGEPPCIPRINFSKRIRVLLLNNDWNFLFHSRINDWYNATLILTPQYVAEVNRGIAHRVRQRETMTKANLNDIKKKYFR